MKKLLLLAILYSTTSFSKDCSVACGSGFDSCALIALIEVEKRFDDLNQAYIAKVISRKHPPKSYTRVIKLDGINDEGFFTKSEVIKKKLPDEIILVEHGIRPVGKNNEFMEIIVQDHGSAMNYEVGRKYYFFGREIRDNIYETSKASCTMLVQ